MRVLIIVLFCSLTGCMVGPDFHSPPPPQTSTYTYKPFPKKTVATASKIAGKAQIFVKGKDISAEWWRVFHSKEINWLIDRGIANNQNLTAAYASLRQAQEIWNAQFGNSMLPAFNLAALAQRSRSPSIGGGSNTTSSTTSSGGLGAAAGGSNVFNLFNANVNVAYTLDVFGGLRRQLEALQAQVDNQQFQLIGVYLTMSANIATTAIAIAELDAEIKATKDLLHDQTYQLNIFRKQLKLGGISNEAVLAQETLVGQTATTIPPLEFRRDQNRHALAVLVGDLPNAPLPIPKLASLHLPSHLPVSLPSNLVRQRPDVRASEALVHSASANIGVAVANLLPTFTLSGAYGYQGIVASNLFSNSNKLWNIALQATQPLFHGGALFAQRRQAIAAYDQALATYKETVLVAFQNVADSLRALETDARTLLAADQAETAAKRALDLVTQQYKLGGVSYLNLIIANQQYHQAFIVLIRAQAARLADSAALYQALGGGWWHKDWCVKEKLGYC